MRYYPRLSNEEISFGQDLAISIANQNIDRLRFINYSFIENIMLLQQLATNLELVNEPVKVLFIKEVCSGRIVRFEDLIENLFYLYYIMEKKPINTAVYNKVITVEFRLYELLKQLEPKDERFLQLAQQIVDCGKVEEDYNIGRTLVLDEKKKK